MTPTNDNYGVYSPEKIKEATAWLLLAYSVGHTDDCSCEHCPRARRIAYRARAQFEVA